jgi:soluble lytic murein transglycosylase
MDEGRYASAISQFSALVGSTNIEESHDALWGLAAAYNADDQSDLAIRTYSLFTYLRDDPRAARAFFRIGQIHKDEGRWNLIQPAYEEYNKHAGPARHAVMLLRAGLLGSSIDAISIYKGVIQDNPTDVDLREALRSLAGLYATLDKHKDAVETYNRLATLEKNDPRPLLDGAAAPAEVMAAAEMQKSGDAAGARKRLLDYINNANNTSDGRFLAMSQLLNIEPSATVSGTIDTLQAARIAFDSGYYRTAINDLDTLRTTETNPQRRAAAALLTGRAFSASGDYASAFNWYTATIQTYPTAPEAAEAARRAGDVLREQAAWDDAMAAYTLAVTGYSTSPEADLARLHGGVLAYRLEQQDTALSLLEPLLGKQEFSPTLKSEAAFWAGKIQKASGKAGWQDTLKQVSSLNPDTFFDFRARSILAGEPLDGPVAPSFTESSVQTVTLGIQFDEEGPEREELFRWAASLGGSQPAASPPETDTVASTLSPRIANDKEVQRAIALLQIDYKTEYLLAFRLIAERMKATNDAEGLAEIVTYLRYHADPRTAMLVGETLASMDKSGDRSHLPGLLLKTLYPTPYSSIVLPEAETRDIDPLVMYALMRQESQFVPDAHSSADAIGLTQVVPSTGSGIAEQLGDTSYTSNKLYEPYVNIRYGTYYLASNLPQFNRKLLPALAAYNGGPGNASRWLAGSALLDPDLYAERIDLFETGDYLERVYTNFSFYKQIYAR